jgi:putative DNA primase/helicase
MTELVPPPTAPYAVAGRLLEDYEQGGVRTLWSWRGAWMRWESSHWAEAESAEIRSHVYKRLESCSYAKGDELKAWLPNKARVTDVMDALAARSHLPEAIDPPAWLTRHTVAPGEVVACTNGLLHVRSRQLGALTPHFFNRVAVPFDYDPKADEPKRWLGFLNQLWPGDDASIETLQEFFGYVLSGRTDLQKILLLVGPTRSGKGTIARVLSELVGRGNAAGPTLAAIGSNFGLSPLLGKPLAVVSDARLGGTNVHQVVERLLSVSGEDMLTVDRKYREPWTGKLPTRLMILSNELPRFGDASGAIAHRFLVLTMHHSFLGQEDPRLTSDLLEELPSILGWALDGLDRLATVGRFTVPPSSTDAVAAFQDLVSPVSAFVRDRCKLAPGEKVEAAALFAAWKEWCEDNGHRPGTTQTLGRDLRAVAPFVRTTRPRQSDNRARMYQGVSLVVPSGPRWSADLPNYAREEKDPWLDPPKQTMEGTADHADHPLLECPHGMAGGAIPDASLRGRLRCPQCALEEIPR